MKLNEIISIIINISVMVFRSVRFLIQDSRNFKNKILKRILITIGILFFIRLGAFIPIPGVSQKDLIFYLETHSLSKNFFNNLLDKDTFVIGIFTLNIIPVINASLAIQFLSGILPQIAKMQKEGDLQNRRLIEQWRRYITLIVAIFQSIGIALFLRDILVNWNYMLAFEVIIWLTTGGMIILWLSQMIKEYGLGNGTSIIIAGNILISSPNIAKKLILENSPTPLFLISFVLLLTISLYGMIFLQEGIRKIRLVSGKEITEGNFAQIENYIPLRYCQAGIMPLILTTTLLIIPNYLINIGILPKPAFLNYFSPILIFILACSYWILYFLLVFQFSLFYSKLTLKPKEMSERLQILNIAILIPIIPIYLKEMNVNSFKYIIIKPGIQTTFYLEQVIQRISIIGALGLSIFATLPNFLGYILGLPSLNSLSIVSILILVGVILELLREVVSISY
uniref:Subunit Y of preprotein-translocase n=1 Tax=Climaconeis cf. scalaris TaxID=2846828 RepID=A0A8F8SQI2_9STRA|nr:subunit Y of preprotein-translocase [Climaconeis cf. scalaris]QYB19357.1 subunit Y of preprotein-translocase [Climaconeis cf. scalaris]